MIQRLLDLHQLLSVSIVEITLKKWELTICNMKVITNAIRDSLDYYVLDIRTRPGVYSDFFNRLLKPSAVITETDPVLSTLGSRVLGLVRYYCVVSGVEELNYSREYKGYLGYIRERIDSIVSDFSFL